MKKNIKEPAKISGDVIQAAGGLIWREASNGKELAIIHRPKYNDWTLPKGKLEPGETWQQAAARECREETGFDVEFESFAGCTCYCLQGIPKVVLYWNMSLLEPGHFKANKEVDNIQWLSVGEALGRLNYSTERELVEKNSR